MIQQLEESATVDDIISGVPTSCVAVADDVAPCATASHPRDAVHQMQILLNVVEDHGSQLHMRFGAQKCKLLISGRPTKIKAVKTLLVNEPEVLTFYGSPVNTVDDYYVHIGVPQAAHNQSKVMVEYRITKSETLSYKVLPKTPCQVSALSLTGKCSLLTTSQPSSMEQTQCL